jgi:hypothetical protein
MRPVIHTSVVAMERLVAQRIEVTAQVQVGEEQRMKDDLAELSVDHRYRDRLVAEPRTT